MARGSASIILCANFHPKQRYTVFYHSFLKHLLAERKSFPVIMVEPT